MGTRIIFCLLYFNTGVAVVSGQSSGVPLTLTYLGRSNNATTIAVR